MAYVALDYGHGRDTFPPSKGVYHDGKAYHEHEFNADVGEQIRHILEQHGVQVLVTQPPNADDVGLNYRTNLANRENVDLFVSIHANAGVPSAQGTCVFAWEGYAGANRVADLVVEQLAERGVDLHGNGRHYSQFGSWTNFHVLRETDMSAILIEHGFMTNDRDFENIFGENSVVYRHKCAVADAKAILTYFGIAYKADSGESDGKQTYTPPKKRAKPAEVERKNWLEKGDSGARVTEMQRNLLALGYDMDGYGADGHFGEATEDALLAFQRTRGLKVDGYYGPASQAEMKRALAEEKAESKRKQAEPSERYNLDAIVPYPGVLKRGSTGKNVKRLQRALGIVVDGHFGPATERAVKAYQKERGLKVDGMVGPVTHGVLY